MRMILTVALLAAGPAAMAQTRAAAAQPGVASGGRCEALASDWRRYEMNLADRSAESIGDNSAPRATLRAIEDSNDLLAASMTLSLMRDNRCTLPARAPNGAAYMLPAMECRTARLRASGTEQPPACARENWRRTE